jgi:hypothetical protein
VPAAMDAALQNGLEVTALHNHFFFDDPRVFFMHIGGSGSLGALSTGVGRVFAAVASAKPAASAPAVPSPSSIDPAPLDGILHANGQAKDGMVKYVFGRTTAMHGADVGNAMGVNTWAVFAGAPDRALVDGDFAMLEDELQAVLKALRAHGVQVVAIHNHMTHEQPRIMFLHYWAKGPASELATALRTALDAQTR